MADGAQVFVSQLALIERVIAFVCRRHHLSAVDAEDFASHAKLKLINQDYAILRNFEGRSSLRTYLTITINRAFLDYRNAAWGKWRPSAEARRAGPVTVLLERLVSRDNYQADEAFAILTVNHRLPISRDDFERQIERLPPRMPRRIEGEDALLEHPDPTSPEDGLLRSESQLAADHVRSVLKGALAEMPPQDRLILTMRFQDGRSIVDIATILGLDQKRTYRQVDRLLKTLRATMEAAGVSAADVAALMNDPSDGLDAAENPDARPSNKGGPTEWQ